MDIDGNGLIDFDEFCLGMATHSRAKQAESKQQVSDQTYCHWKLKWSSSTF